MNDLVNRSEVKNIAKGFTFTFGEERQRYMDFLDYCLDNAPTVDAVPVVHGEWKKPILTYLVCNICGNKQPIASAINFCPNCGADMRKKV